MKRGIVRCVDIQKMRYKLYFVFCVLCFFALVSAAPTLTLQHEQIQPGETILATINITGEFTEYIDKSQIKFFEGRKQTTLESNIFFYNNSHYLYIYTTKEQNLTLRIENILYKEAGSLKSATIEQNLTIQKNFLYDEETNETYAQILKIKPGFVSATEIAELELINMGTRIINLTFNDEEISLTPLSSEEINFTLEEAFSFVVISTYKDFLIPTVYTPSENATFVSPAVKLDLRHDPDLLLIETFTESSSKEIIDLFNFGDENLTNLEAVSSIDFIEIEELRDMSGRGVQNMTLTLSPENPGHFQGTVNVSYTQNGTDNVLEIPLSIFVLPKGTTTTDESFQVREETCQEISGQICASGFLCNGTPIFTKNAEYCCLDSCLKTELKKSESNGFGWLIGIVIIIILGLVGTYFYQKQKQLKPETPKDTLQKTTEKFEKRLTENPSQRTSGSLTKS